MYGSIINRMIWWELVRVFGMALAALTGMFLLAGIIQEASQRGLSATQIFAVLPLLIPNTLPYTIPATTLFATCVVYGRMAHDSEILVLKAAGVNIIHLLKPALLLGVLAALATSVLYYDTIPRSQRLMRERIVADAEEFLYGVLRREGALKQNSLPYVMYVREVQGKKLIDVIFKRRVKVNGEWRYDLVARTKKADIRIDFDNNQLVLDMGRCIAVGKDTNGDFGDRQYPVPLPDQLFGKDQRNRPSALTWEELQARRVELEQEIAGWDAKRAAAEARMAILPVTDPQREVARSEMENARNEAQLSRRTVRVCETEMHMRPALAVGCICFVLIGCPVGIWASRADYLSTFVICFLPTVFVYYPMLLAGGNLAKDGKVSAMYGVWAADAVLGTIAILLVGRLMRR